ncbi:MAG TPA: 50S ribosomal protein L15e [Nitrososphaerales archaeon]|nr:50S ribosomal protein L15e [Nitrososphaerales archaeon]
MSYRQISESWQSIFHEKTGDIRARAVELRKEPALLRLERPSRLDRARSLGYKAKKGIIVVRARVSRGGMRKQRPRSGRRSKHMGVLKIKSDVSAQEVAERRAGERYPNMKVIGSYPIWKDGRFAWFECVMVDPLSPSIKSDYNFKRSLGVLS